MCAGLFFCERGARERNAFERDAFERDAREACAACRRGFVGGWLLGCRNSAKTASKILKLASEAAQTVRIFEATQISASQESAPLLQKQSQTASPSAAGASSEKKCRLTIGCGASALRWTTARAEFVFGWGDG